MKMPGIIRLFFFIGMIIPSLGSASEPLFSTGNRNNGEFAVNSDQVTLADRFNLKFIKPGWKGNYDSIVKIAAPELQPDALKYTATVGHLGGYRVQLKKISPTALSCVYDIVIFGRIPIDATFISVIIPGEFAQQRGTFSTSAGSKTPFPFIRQKNQTVFSGSAQSFTWTDGLGRSIRLIFPCKVKVNLSDLRQWGRPVFELRIFLPLPKTPASISFPLIIQTSPEKTPVKSFVDCFGQCTLADWPEKVRTETDLKNDIQKENQFLDKNQPPQRDEFGGWVGSREKFNLQATGFFRVEKIKDRWWLVDPRGNLFFSLGTFFVYLDTYTIPKGREELFEWLPERTGPQAKTWMTLQGNECVSFYKSNLMKKYGQNWGQQWYENAVRRWTSWGFNTTSAFGGRLRQIPYANGPYQFIDQCAPAIPNASADIFDPNLPQKLDDLCKIKLEKLKNDPLFIGYFFGNEQTFEKIPAVVPQLPKTYAAKRKLVEFLTARYKNVAQFNQAWKLSVKNFSDLASMKFSATTPKAKADMDAYLALYCDTYGKLLSSTVRKYDPNHLLLGFRWTPITAKNKIIVENLGKYMDVISLNYYTRTGLNINFLANLHKHSGQKPILLSEWSYGTCERGHTGGIINVADQNDRGEHYRDYVETAATLPYVVGCHWYQYVDQALTGRYFGGSRAERCNSGLVDITDRPYSQFLNHVIKTNYQIYDTLSGKNKPFKLPRPQQ